MCIEDNLHIAQESSILNQEVNCAYTNSFAHFFVCLFAGWFFAHSFTNKVQQSSHS